MFKQVFLKNYIVSLHNFILLIYILYCINLDSYMYSCVVSRLEKSSTSSGIYLPLS